MVMLPDYLVQRGDFRISISDRLQGIYLIADFSSFDAVEPTQSTLLGHGGSRGELSVLASSALITT